MVYLAKRKAAISAMLMRCIRKRVEGGGSFINIACVRAAAYKPAPAVRSIYKLHAVAVIYIIACTIIESKAGALLPAAATQVYYYQVVLCLTYVSKRLTV